MDGHHAHRVAGARRVALDLDVAAREPGEEAVERGAFLRFELERAGDQFLDRVARRLAEPLEQLAARVGGARQEGFEEARRGDEVGAGEQVDEQGEGGAECGSPRRAWSALHSEPRAAVGEVAQLLLVEADDRRDQQPGEVEIVVRLDREADRGEQILDRQRLRQMQPVDPRDRHAVGVEPGDEQAGELGAAADEDQDVAGAQRALGRWRAARPRRATP